MLRILKKNCLLLSLFFFALSSLSVPTYAYDYGRWLQSLFERYYGDSQQDLSSITGIVLESGGDFDDNHRDYDILLQAVLAAQIEGFLDDADQDLTVFAPNDAAFIKLANDLGYEGNSEADAYDVIVQTLTLLGEGDPIPLLTTILQYHVLDESLFFVELRQLDSVTTLAGSNIIPRYRQLFDAEPELKNPRIILRSSNIKASNGVIHTISRVLIPVDLDNTPAEANTITELVAASGGEFDNNYYDYDLLLQAVLAAGLDDELSSLQDLTVFAPNDLAFVRLARSLGYQGIDEGEAFDFILTAVTDLVGGDPVPLITDILLYHVSPSTLSLTEVISSDDVATLFVDESIRPQGKVLADADDGLRDPRLIFSKSDLRASNGLVHTINRVLLPISVTELIH